MPQLDMKAVTGCEVTAVTALSAIERSNGAMPQPDEKTATGREVDPFDNLIREPEV